MAIGVGLALAVLALTAWRIIAVSNDILTARHKRPADPLAVAPLAANAGTGARLVHLDGCTDCHGGDLTGRVIFSGVFGTRLVAPNLTAIVPHLSDAQLASAIRFGVKPDGTTLLDMPVGKFLQSSDSDIAAIIAYLRSLPPKPDGAPKPRWGFAGRMMLAMGLIEVDADSLAKRGPEQTPHTPAALGRYIAQVHCSGCHGAGLHGDPQFNSPDLHKVIEAYTEASFVRFFATGNAHLKHPTRAMTRLIRDRFKYLTTKESKALYAYLAKPKAPAAPATP